MERCETPASRSLSSSALGSAANASLAPAAMAKALVCFPPSLDLMARKDRVSHRVPGRPTAREAAVGARLHNLGLALPFGQLPRRATAALDST